MKGISQIALLAIGGFLAAGCGSQTTINVNANTNRISMTNTAANTISNAANTVANTVSNTAASLRTDSPEEFMKSAAHGGVAVVELGKLAGTNAQNAEVKSFGQMMVNDHSKANTELKSLAAKKNLTLPTDPGPHASTIEDLKGLKGAEFDRVYVEAMVEDHETDVAAFQRQADNSSDPDVKAFAAKTLPVLKTHLERIKGIQSKMQQQKGNSNK
jgi:putative membrane protein